MSNELKIGILAVVTIALTFWGFKFIKGKNILNASNTFYVKYDDVDQLTNSAPILIRGLKVGTVASVELADDLKTVIAILDIDRNIKIPKTTQALVISTSIMGGKGIELTFDKACSGADCAKSGDYLNGRVKGMVESMLGTDNLDSYVDKVKAGIGSIARAAEDSLMAPGADSEIAMSIKNISETLKHLESITGKLSNSMDSYDRRVQSIMGNLQSLTKDLSDQTPQISSALSNMSAISEDIKNAELGNTLKKSGEVMDKASEAFTTLNTTLASADKSVQKLEALMTSLNSTDGTLGKMLNDKELYNEILLTTSNLQLLLQDFRLNPKRYVNVSVFGKKQKEYEVPEDDPAFQEE